MPRLRPYTPRHRARPLGRGFATLLFALPLASASAVLFWDRVPDAQAAVQFLARLPEAPGKDREHFARCGAGPRVTCVVDGDTIWYHGTKIRVADINAPEVSHPDCRAEAQLGEQATDRLIALLNQGPFTLEPVEREHDRYGRTLRTVMRGGKSVGAELVDEGLAERWTGHRRYWC